MRSAVFIVALLVLSGALVSPAAAVLSDGDRAPQVDQQSRIGDPVSTDIVVALQANGSARWTVTVTYTLDSDAERAAFEVYQSEFENGSADGLDADLFETLAAEGSQSSGRQMSIEEVEYRSAATESEGSLTLAFTWTNFLERTGEGSLQFHDAVLLAESRPEKQSWLSTLDANQTMTIRTPPGYSVNSTQAPSFEFANNSVVIDGPQRFDGDLTVTYQQTSTPEDTPWELLLGALVIAVAVVVAAVVLRRRGGSDVSAPPTSTATEGSPNGGTSPDEGVQPSADGDGRESDDEAEEVDLSLLSDEERVEHLLEQNGGRMKQANIVQETGWSDAKVSQLLSSMADEERVQKLRLGRENLISLPDEDET
jgi:uncharacterized membrane protein